MGLDWKCALGSVIFWGHSCRVGFAAQTALAQATARIGKRRTFNAQRSTLNGHERMEPATAIDFAAGNYRTGRSRAARDRRFSTTNRIDPALRGDLCCALLGKRKMVDGAWKIGDGVRN